MDEASKSFLDSDVIDDEFFIDIVERKLNITRDQFKLRLVFITPAAGKNDNYASVVYRAKISIEMTETKEKKLVNVIIKALIATIQELKEFAIFDREIVMYQDVIENMEDLILSSTEEKVEFSPKCIKIMKEPYEVLVLDDLKSEGYDMVDRKVGLGLEESKLVLTKLAKFHAASAIIYHKFYFLEGTQLPNMEGTISKLLDRISMIEDNGANKPEQQEKNFIFFGKLYQKLVETVGSQQGYESIFEKAMKWDFMKIMTTYIATAEPMQNGFIVLNHGDDWVNNMMFKYDEDGKVSDMKFIDFQLSFWGSPANDIIYFLVSSVKDEIKIDHFDDLIQHYHEELTDSLRKLNYDKPIPTLYEIHVDLLQKGGGFAFHLMFVMFIAKYNSNQELNLHSLWDPIEGKEGLDAAFSNPIYIAALLKWLPFLNKRGFLDVLLPNASNTPFMQAMLDKLPKL